jgi:hypothetical protein
MKNTYGQKNGTSGIFLVLKVFSSGATKICTELSTETVKNIPGIAQAPQRKGKSTDFCASMTPIQPEFPHESIADIDR